MLPPSRPRLTEQSARAMLAQRFGDAPLAHPLIVVGFRGYYRDSMGAPGRNDRMIYDDAIGILTPNAFAMFNGNTDPNGYRKGAGTGSRKGMATLNAGWWPVYRFDLHRGKYLALCQRGGEVTVTRDGDPPYQDTGEFGINIHRGGNTTTSSLGCQTIPPAQWPAFISLAEAEARRLFGDRWKRTNIPYALIEP